MIMEDRDNPNLDRENDLSKAQNQQQPTSQSQQQQPTDQSAQHPFGKEGQAGESFGQQQQPTGQADYGSAGQSDSVTQQRSDIEGGTATGQASGQATGQGQSAEGSFLGSKAKSDTSASLIEDEDSTDFSRDGQGAPE
jgi:hypothetical protein